MPTMYSSGHLLCYRTLSVSYSHNDGFCVSGPCIARERSNRCAGFEISWFDETSGTESFVTGTTKIIDTDVAATGAVELHKKSALGTARQHASVFAERKVLLRQTAFVAVAREDGHVSLFDQLCVY